MNVLNVKIICSTIIGIFYFYLFFEWAFQNVNFNLYIGIQTQYII